MSHRQVVDLLPAARAGRQNDVGLVAMAWLWAAMSGWQLWRDCWHDPSQGSRLGEAFGGATGGVLPQASVGMVVVGAVMFLAMARRLRRAPARDRWLPAIGAAGIVVCAAVGLSAGPLQRYADQRALAVFEACTAPLAAAMDRTGQPPSDAALAETAGRLGAALPALDWYTSLAVERPLRRYYWRDGRSAVVDNSGRVQSVWRGACIDYAGERSWSGVPVESLIDEYGQPRRFAPTFPEPWRLRFTNGSGLLVRVPGARRWRLATGWSLGKIDGEPKVCY